MSCPASYPEGPLDSLQKNTLCCRELDANLYQVQQLPQLAPEARMQHLSEVQQWVKLLHIREKLIQQLGYSPSHSIWAGAANLSQVELLKCLAQGRRAKTALLKSSLRWVFQAIQAAQMEPSQVKPSIRAGLKCLEQAIETYNPAQHSSFAKHAQWWIQLGIEKASQSHVTGDFSSIHPAKPQFSEDKSNQNTQKKLKISSLDHSHMPINQKL